MQTHDHAEAEGRWRRLRVPNLIFSWGPVATVLVYMALTWSEPAGYVETIDQLVSWPYLVGEVLFGILAALCVMGWLVPRITAVALIVSISPLAEPVQDPVAQHLWILWCGILAVDWIMRSTQQSLDVAVGDTTATDLAAHVRDRRSDLFSLERRAAVGLLALGVLVSSWFWLDRRQELIELDTRARPASGTVTGVDTLYDVVTVRVAGATHEFWVGDAALLRVGQRVPVLVDPTDRERPYGLGDADPDSWSALLVLVGVLSTLTALTAGYGPLQRRRLAALVSAGEPGRPALVLHDDEGVRVWTLGTDPGRDPASALLPAAAPIGDLDELDHLGDLDDLNDLDELEDLDDLDELDDAPPTPEAAIIHGLRSDGGPTVVVHVDGSTFASLRAARDPWTTSAVARVVRDRVVTLLGRR